MTSAGYRRKRNKKERETVRRTANFLEWPLLSGCHMTRLDFRRSLVSGLPGEERGLLSRTAAGYIIRTTIIYSVHEHDFGSPWLWDVNRGNSCISFAIFWLQWPVKLKIESMEEYSEAMIYKSKPELRNSNVNADYFCSSAEIFESVASCTELLCLKITSKSKNEILALILIANALSNLWLRPLFKRRILHAPNRIAELSECKMRRLNQLNATYFT